MKVIHINNLNKNSYADIDLEYQFYLSPLKMINIPFSYKWDTVAVSLSGGLNSALVLYLLAKTFQAQGIETKIQPITFRFLDRVDSSVNVPAIIAKIKEITGYNAILDAKLHTVPLDVSEDPIKKPEFVTQKLKELVDNWEVDFFFNGKISNPPENIRKEFHNNEQRHKSRDNPKSIYNTETDVSPLLLINKVEVVNFLIFHEIFDAIAPLTISCDQKLSVISANNLSVPCNQCWWCDSKKYAYSVNNKSIL